MSKDQIKRQIISWGLLFSLLAPLSLDAMHYAIYHHDDCELSQDLQFQSEQNPHLLCKYPFVTEEIIEATLIIQHFERVLEVWLPAEIRISEQLNFFSNHLRGPPALNLIF